MSDKNDGGPAFPRMGGPVEGPNTSEGVCPQEGMPLRQYAAIHLRVPYSGTPWLDEMVARAERRDLAGLALQGLIGRQIAHKYSQIHQDAFDEADALIAEGKK